jgi:molecular chaperone Hsp33
LIPQLEGLKPCRASLYRPNVLASHLRRAPVTNLDEAIGFTLPHRHARGPPRALGPVLDQILAAHEYPAPIARILSEALTLTALLGAMLKDAGGQLTVQAQTESGIIDLLVCDYRGG